MAKDDNKHLVLNAIWSNPAPVFGCAFVPQGAYQANEKCTKYPEKGRIRLKQTATGGITLYYNKQDREGSNGIDVLTWLERYELGTCGFNDTLQALAKVYGIDLKYSKEEVHKMNRQTLAREVAPLLVEQLKANPDGDASKYLRDVRQLANDNQHFGELTEAGIKAIQDTLKQRGFKYDQNDFIELGLTYQNANHGFNLVIPQYCNGVLNGFVLRNVRKGVEPKDRYRNSAEIGRNGYCDRLDIGTMAVFVEGQFDALRLKQAGVANVVAIGGAEIGEGIGKLLKAHNISQVIYIPDLELDQNQQRDNTKLVNNAIKKFQNVAVDGEKVITNLYVADLPTPQNLAPFKTAKGGYKIDADEYGKAFGASELVNAVNNCVPSWVFECNQLVSWGIEETNRNGAVNVGEIQNRFDDIYNRTTNEFERQRIKDYVKANDVFKPFGITASALDDKDEWNRGRKYNEEVKALSQELADAVQNQASPVVINRILAKFKELQGTDTRTEWDKQLNQTFDDELEEIRNQPDTLVTKWELGNLRKNKYTNNNDYFKYCNIEYYPADIEVFCAPTSHGKTMILFQSALDLIAKTKKIYLYVSCEENKRQLVERALNVFIDIPNTETGNDKNGQYCFISDTRKKTIKAILRKQPGCFGYAPEHYQALCARVDEWVGLYRQQVRPYLKLVHTDGTAESICSNVLYYTRQIQDQGGEVGGVFVDYMQLLTSENSSYSRHDELKDVCIELKTLASQIELPIVIGAQLNREVMRKDFGIDNVSVANIGEGADIERIAHDIYLLWQVDKTPLQPFTKTETDKVTKHPTTTVAPTGIRSTRLFTKPGLRPEEQPQLKTGYMYIEQLKARDGKTDGWGLMEFDGERGFIGVNNVEIMKQ